MRIVGMPIVPIGPCTWVEVMNAWLMAKTSGHRVVSWSAAWDGANWTWDWFKA